MGSLCYYIVESMEQQECCLTWWTRQIGESDSNGSSEVCRGISSTLAKRPPKDHPPPKKWSPPPLNWYKVNMDDTVFRDQGSIGVGVVIRN